MESISSRQSFCDRFSQALLNRLKKHYPNGTGHEFQKCLLHHSKSNKNDHKCDFMIPRSLIRHLSIIFADDEHASFTEIFEAELNTLRKEGLDYQLQISAWKKANDNYVINVDRVFYFKAVVQNILSMTYKPECPRKINRTRIIFCHVNEVPILEDLRSLLLLSLIDQYAEHQGIYVAARNQLNMPEYEEVCKILGLNLLISRPECESYHRQTDESLKNLSQDVRFCDISDISLSQTRQNSFYATAYSSKATKSHKNIWCHSVRHSLSEKRREHIGCIHVCSQKTLISAQQSELYHIWQEVIAKTESTSHRDIHGCYDHYLTHTGTDDPGTTASEFIKTRTEQIKENFESKLHISAEGGYWEETIGKMRTALIKLEFYFASVHTKLRFSSAKEPMSNDAVFILYNFSRLSTLIKTFEDKVENGEYPALPALEDIDFSLLVEDSEWELLINHLWTYQDIKRKPLVDISDTVIALNTHAVVNHLHQLSRCLSTFYSRHHILVENLPHLLPRMYTRIYLVKATLRVMDELFCELNIKPLHQM